MPYNYELTLILSTKLTDEKQKKLLDEVKKYIAAASGILKESKLLGRKKLAYPVARETDGFYYIMTYQLDGKETAQFSKKLALNEGILRYLVIRR